MELVRQTADRGNLQEVFSAQPQQAYHTSPDYEWEEFELLDEARRQYLSPNTTWDISSVPSALRNGTYLLPITFMWDSKRRWRDAITTQLTSALTNDMVAEAAEPDPVEEKLKRIERFTAGWHFGEGLPLDAGALRQTREIHQFGKALSLEADVFPHEDGDLSIMFKSGNQYLEIWCQPGGRLSFSIEEGMDHPFTLVTENKTASFSDVLTELLTFARSESLWDYCGSFTPISTAAVLTDSPLTVFAIPRVEKMENLCQRMNAELAYSTITACVSALQINISVNTFQKNMEELRLSENPHISGFSPIYQRELR